MPKCHLYFNPRSPCGERLDLRGIKIGKYIFQSTLPVRGATAIILIPVGTEEFQSTLPVRGATIQQFPANAARKFQSTLPVRGATITRFQNISNPIKFQSTLPVRGATKSIMEIATLASISIHAPRAGSDPRAAKKRPLRGRFQSTLPVRGATAAAGWNCAVEADFNPRSPCGERRTTGEEAVIPMLISIHAPRAGSDTTAR